MEKIRGKAIEFLNEYYSLMKEDILNDKSSVSNFIKENKLTDYYFQYYLSLSTSKGMRARFQRFYYCCRRIMLYQVVKDLQLKTRKPLRVLDIGCGFGGDSFLFRHLGCEVTGIDLMPDKIGIAKHRIEYWNTLQNSNTPPPTFLVADASDFIGDNQRYDIIFCAEALHHCEPPENTLLTMRSLISSNGKVIICEANGGSFVAQYLCKRARTKSRQPLRSLHLSPSTDKYILFGNENIRSLSKWNLICQDCGFTIDNAILCGNLFVGGAINNLRTAHVLDSIFARMYPLNKFSIGLTFCIIPKNLQGEKSLMHY
ncbi:class I SAM-dependent methyltransferase [Patescibacteria group bacterium]|nr:class I SAM-dependent methyltransferase [Patescibacteria group bacterium]